MVQGGLTVVTHAVSSESRDIGMSYAAETYPVATDTTSNSDTRVLAPAGKKPETLAVSFAGTSRLFAISSNEKGGGDLTVAFQGSYTFEHLYF